MQTDRSDERADPRLVALGLLTEALGGDVLVVEDDRLRNVAVSKARREE